MEEEKKSFEIEGGGRKQEKKIRYIFKPPKGLHFRNAADTFRISDIYICTHA